MLTLLPLIYAADAAGVAAYAAGRAALRRRWAETALDEEAGLVSLLLREFEENGADWLWEIDVRKRLRRCHASPCEAFGRPVEKLQERPLIGLLAGVGSPRAATRRGCALCSTCSTRGEASRITSCPY